MVLPAIQSFLHSVEKLWNDVADFALEENGTQDELLDD
jgi:hypothetical protein